MKKEKLLFIAECHKRGQVDDLKSQEKAMETYCLNAGIWVDEWISEIGGGLNFKRKKFLNIMKGIRLGEINHLIVAHKDRLDRTRYNLIHPRNALRHPTKAKIKGRSH